MITIFNRREVYITFSLQQEIQIRNMLGDRGIETLVRVKTNRMQNHGGAALLLSHRGFGELDSYLNEYKVFVHRRDYERAMATLRGI